MQTTQSFRFSVQISAFLAFMAAIGVPLRASGVATQQAALGLALLAALVLCVFDRETRRYVSQAFRSVVAKAVAVVFVAWGMTILFSYDPVGSLRMGVRVGAFLGAAVLIWAALVAHPNVHMRLRKTVLAAALAVVLLALLSLNGVPLILSLLKGQWLASEHPELAFKAFAATAMCLIPVAVWSGRTLGGGWRWAGYAYVPLALMVMVQTGNRSVLAGVVVMAIVGIVLVAVARRKHAFSVLAVTIACCVGAAAWLHAAGMGRLKIDGLYLPNWLVDPHRQRIWAFVYDRFLDHPWVGNGIDQLNRLPGANLSVPGLPSSAAFVPSHPHNWALEILAETGIVGFLPMLLVLGFVAWRVLKRYLQTRDEGDFALLMLVAGFWSSALFNFSIWAAWWQLTFFVLFAIIASSRSYPGREKRG